MPPTRKMDLATYNFLAQRLNDIGNSGGGAAWAYTCSSSMWEDLDILVSPARLNKQAFEYLKAGALTLDNTLDYDTANSVDWAHDDLYTETMKADAWKDCVGIDLQYLTDKILGVSECPDIEFPGGCFYNPQGPVAAEEAARATVAAARTAWINAVNTNTDLAFYSANFDSAAASQQTLARQLYNKWPGYVSLWNWIPSNTGYTFPVPNRFYQTYNPGGGGHLRDYIGAERQLFLHWAWYYDTDETYGMPSGSLTLTSSPNGTLCAIFSGSNITSYFTETHWTTSDPAPFPFTTEGNRVRKTLSNRTVG